MDLCVDHAWPHCVDANAFGREFARESAGEAFDRRLGGSVIDEHAGGARLHEAGRHVHNRAAAAAIARRHALQCLARAEHRAEDIGRVELLNPGEIHVLEPACVREDPGVVDERVDAPEFAVHRSE
jgi:hypothetical protein